MEKPKAPQSSEFSELVKKYSPFFKEARKRLVFTLLVFALATVGGFVFYEKIIRFLVSLFSLKGLNIVFTSPFQFINLAISCGVSTGLIFTFPLLVWQIMSFLKPALTKSEHKMLINFLPFSLILFIIGFSFGAYIMKWQIEIFLEQSISLGIGNILDISGLLTTVLLTSALLGVGFQFPIVLLILMKLNLLSRKQLGKKRPLIYLASLIFAILLPANSVLADVLLSLPLVFLFEITLLLNFVFSKNRPIPAGG